MPNRPPVHQSRELARIKEAEATLPVREDGAMFDWLPEQITRVRVADAAREQDWKFVLNPAATEDDIRRSEAALGLPLGRQARIVVTPTLQVPEHPEVFVIGDLAGAVDQIGGAPLPMLIPVGMQEGKKVAATISDLLRGYGPTNFDYRDPGIMATIGRNSAVAQLGAVRLTGFLGWLMWLFVHLINVISFRSRIVVLVNWAWDYFFYDRPIRLILRAAGEKAARPR